MKIHAIQTGTVAITANWREGVGHGKRRLLITLLDRRWTEHVANPGTAIPWSEVRRKLLE